MNQEISNAIEKARREWPPMFALSEIDRLSGGALRRRTIHNLRSKKEIPANCFFMQGSRKVLVARDELLAWWVSQLSECKAK